MENKVIVTTYFEHTDDPGTWKSPRPGFDVDKFNRELERRCGYVDGVPRFRMRWAGDLPEYVLEDYDVLTGGRYKKADGTEVFVKPDEKHDFPDDVIIAPVYENHLIFTPRFVMEEFNKERGWYQKAWFIENLKKADEHHGRTDAVSYYREPAEVDFAMAEHLTKLRLNLSQSDIQKGLERLEREYNQQQAHMKAERQAGMVEMAERALIDGIADAPKFNWKPKNTSIKDYSHALVKEHNKTI